jgi:hypothetical protein
MAQYIISLIAIATLVYVSTRVIRWPTDKVVRTVKNEMFSRAELHQGLSRKQEDEVEKIVFHRTNTRFNNYLDYVYMALLFPGALCLMIFHGGKDFGAPNWLVQLLSIFVYWVVYVLVTTTS